MQINKYFSKYQTEEDYNNNKDTHSKPHVSYIVNPTKQMVYIQKSYIEQYFTIEALEDDLTVSLSQNACEYRIDNGSWNTLSAGTNTPSINKGQTLSFRGNLTPNSGINTFIIPPTPPDINNNYGIGTFNISKNCNIKGNIMSLLYGDDFIGQNDLTSKDYAFFELFFYCGTIVDASKLILPATTLEIQCYAHMFSNCTSLTTAPELPATTLAKSCYSSMFSNCTSLTTAPELPATTLSTRCYNGMFEGCTGLSTSPKLPATTLAYGCYNGMFYGTNVLPDCSNIDFTNITVVASGGLSGLFSGTKVTDADLERILPKNIKGKYCLPTTTLASGCYNGMFSGCTSLTTAPELPATTLADNCYMGMFEGCTSLTSVPALPATTLAIWCYGHMFSGCTSLTTAPELPATILANYCYYYMFYRCTSLTSATELPATTLAADCYQSMFRECTNLTTAPELPATTLENYCYDSMFYGCSKLSYIKMLATDISASSCLQSWVRHVAPNGTFVKNANMTTLPSGIDGIPSGWTVEDYSESNLITFTIDGTEYQAEEGMTWEEWCNSEYNKIQMRVISTGTNLIVGLNPPYNTLIRDYTVYGQDLIITGGVYKNCYNDF